MCAGLEARSSASFKARRGADRLNKLTDDQLRNAVSALRAAKGNESEAARMMGIPRPTYQNYLKRAKERGMLAGRSAPSGGLELPDFPVDDIPIEDVIEQMSARFETRRRSYDAHTWFPVKMADSKPIGLLFAGDPHLDDGGANWPLIKEHAKICRETEGIYGVNIGDSTNCWGGRLIKKYADQDTSLKTARRLVEWFLLDSGIRWLIWLYGNHEQMGDGSALLAQMAKRYKTQAVVMHDWEARFSLNFPGGTSIRIFTAHDLPGNSIWNPLHGPVKAAMLGKDIDLLVCGHKHNWAMSQWELAEQGTAPLMIRTRGYKHFDDFAKRIGKIEQDEGASILTVINPKSQSRAGRLLSFVDIAAGADYLTWLRKRAT